MKLAGMFGASVYAACHEYARTNPRACAVYALEPLTYCAPHGARADVRRIETSPLFRQQFGQPADLAITLDHALGRVLPIGRKMTKPTTLSMTDRNGVPHECVAEAFNTTFNILILLYPVRALTRTTLVFGPV